MIRVLILSRHPDSHGGVVNYLELLKARLTAGVLADSFIIGRRPDEVSLLMAAPRLIADLLRFGWTVSRTRYEIIHLNPTLNLKSTLRESLFLLVLKLLQHDRFLVFFRGWDHSVEERISTNTLARRLFVRLYGSAQATLVLSTKFRDALIRMGFPADRVHTTTTMFDGHPLSQALAEAGRDHQRRTVLFLSRFVREKGVYELLQAFSRIHSRFPDYNLVMAGDGEEMAKLKKLAERLGIERQVQFPGYLKGIEKARAFVNARVFVLATTGNEGLPNALLEALAAGNVVITTRVAGIPEVIDDPANGILLDEVTTDSVQAALERALSDEEYCRATRDNNMAKAATHYEADVVTRHVEGIYRRLAGGMRGSCEQPATAYDESA